MTVTIPDIRLDFIRQKVEELNTKLNIQNYPIIMLDTLDQHFSDKYLIHFTEFSEKAEVVTNYYPDYEECVIIINEKCMQDSLEKRLNFSLAHEFGHIVLKHHLRVDGIGLPQYYEREADEFAGQFLMPENELECLPRKVQLLSNYFFVSERAVSVRLDKLKERHKNAARKVKKDQQDPNSMILAQIEYRFYDP